MVSRGARALVDPRSCSARANYLDEAQNIIRKEVKGRGPPEAQGHAVVRALPLAGKGVRCNAIDC